MSGIGEGRRFYIIMNKGFKLLLDDNDIKEHALKHVGGELQVFVEVEAEVGLNEQSVEGDKGKGIMESEHESNDLGVSNSIADDEGDMVRDDTLSGSGDDTLSGEGGESGDDTLFGEGGESGDNTLFGLEEVTTGAEILQGMQQRLEISRSSKQSVDKARKRRKKVASHPSQEKNNAMKSKGKMQTRKKSRVQEGNAKSRNANMRAENAEVVETPNILPPTETVHVEEPAPPTTLPSEISSQHAQVLTIPRPSMFTQMQMSLPSQPTQSQTILEHHHQ
ncbi:hypothetical protein Salat_1495000 [Sesamum alatum]|uniref:Uncharacterized protein n=1 Tax=Sesamum alatum TaxID=300844 RepID=A0AAE1YCG8_9LAMI|nr:hypothetical protein Salat_1495000 [Sesamum alatum]